MSNFWFNIRFGTRHWIWGPDGMRITYNPYQENLRLEDPENWKWFAVYKIFGKYL